MTSRKPHNNKTNGISSSNSNTNVKSSVANKSNKLLYNVNEEDEDSSSLLSPATFVAPSSGSSGPKIDLKKEYIRFCKLYSSEPLDVVATPLEKASYGRDNITVDLKGRGLRGVDCIAIGKILALDAPIAQLNLSDCLLLPQGFQALLDGLCKNSRLHTLELRGNNIQSGMTLSLAKLVKTNCHLKKLLLEWNCLGASKDTFDTFCEALSGNIGLEHLDLRNNTISAECAIELATSLQSNKSLRELDLRWNAVGLVGAKAIWEALRYNFVLQKIHLCGNYIPEDIVRCIEQCLKHQSEREAMMEEYSKRTTLLTRQLHQTEQQHQNEISTIVSVFDAEEAELKDAIKESYDQINDLDARLQNETGRNHSLLKHVEQLQTSLQCANDKEETLRKALEIKEEHTEQLETFFKLEMDKLRTNHELRIKNYQEELEARYKNIEHLSTKVAKLESQLELKSNELEGCQERVEVMKKDSLENRKLFEEKIKAEKEKWANWKEEVETAEKREIHLLEDEVRSIQSNMSDHIKKLEKSKNDAEEKIRQMKITFVTMKAEAEEQSTKMRLKLTAEHDKILQNMANQLAEVKEQIGQQLNVQQTNFADVRRFESENLTLVRQNEHLRQQISNMDKELIEKDAAIHTSLARARNEVKGQIEQLAKEEEANKALRTQVLELQEQSAMLSLRQNREIQEKFSEMDHWKTQVERREAELNRLKEEDMRRAALLHEAFLAYMRSTSAATGIPLPESFFQQNPAWVHSSITDSVRLGAPVKSSTPSGDAPVKSSTSKDIPPY